MTAPIIPIKKVFQPITILVQPCVTRSERLASSGEALPCAPDVLTFYFHGKSWYSILFYGTYGVEMGTVRRFNGMR